MSVGYIIFGIILCSIGCVFFVYGIIKYLILKSKCTYNIEATITDMTLEYGHRGHRFYFPTYTYDFDGKTYTVRGTNGIV